MTDAVEVLRLAAEMLHELDAAAGADDPAKVYGAVVEVAARRLNGVGAASVTTWDGRRYATPAATDDTARQADQRQYDAGAGPCVTAVRDGGSCAGDPGDGGPAVSLQLADGQQTRPAAALNLYAAQPDALAPDTVQLAELLAAHARVLLIAAAHAMHAANLDRSRVSGQQIGAAVGLLMAVKRISHDEARDLLRTTSQQANRRVSDLAAEVVATGMLPGLKKAIGPRRAQPKRPEM